MILKMRIAVNRNFERLNLVFFRHSYNYAVCLFDCLGIFPFDLSILIWRVVARAGSTLPSFCCFLISSRTVPRQDSPLPAPRRAPDHPSRDEEKDGIPVHSWFVRTCRIIEKFFWPRHWACRIRGRAGSQNGVMEKPRRPRYPLASPAKSERAPRSPEALAESIFALLISSSNRARTVSPGMFLAATACIWVRFGRLPSRQVPGS